MTATIQFFLLLGISLGVWILAALFIHALKRSFSNNQEYVRPYLQNVSAGIVAGILVVVLQDVVPDLISLKSIDTTTGTTLILDLMDKGFVILIGIGLIMWTIAMLLYGGFLPSYKK